MDRYSVYIPMDRCQALARGLSLPERQHGTALFADISGFTALTDLLVRELGPQRGAEELTTHLNQVYDTLIDELHRYGGSVISFSGDAITCWFADRELAYPGDAPAHAILAIHQAASELRAATCALAMQRQMAQFAELAAAGGRSVSLAMKTAVATGTVRRFTVGDPDIQLMDVMTGLVLDLVAAGERQARRGEVLLAPATVAGAAGRITVREWRHDDENDLRFGVAGEALDPALPEPWPEIPPEALGEELLRPWLLPLIHERLQAGQGEFLAELRPAVALFLRFSGIDFDGEADAGTRLDMFVREVQRILARYDSPLLQITIGDKGSYLYAAFGAPVAHEDDAARAAAAALELRALGPTLGYLRGLQIGISQGRMRTGAYGGAARRTYGVLGPEVNMAARLMQAAGPAQILVSDPVRRAVPEVFAWERLPDLVVKGRSEPLAVYSLTGTLVRRSASMQPARYALPMVGRNMALAQVEACLERALAGNGQLVSIIGGAGMGKSRLVAEVIRITTARGLAAAGGECQSYGTHTSYLVWQGIWRALFDIDPDLPLPHQVAHLEQSLAAIDPRLVPRLPLLGAVLNLDIPDDELTRSFDAKLRKASLEGLLVEVLRARARAAPLLLILEDCHWIDPLSHDLLESLGRAIAGMRVLLVLAYRPPESERLSALSVTQLPHHTEVRLEEFTAGEAQQLIELKLAQLYGAGTGAPPALVQRLIERAQGNPFYIEELLNYLQDRGINPHDPGAIEGLDLPASLHSLILSRIDQLTEQQKITIKVASVVGRLFTAAVLLGFYPQLGGDQRVRADLEALRRLDLTEVDDGPELTYLFKHIVTQQVAYESLPFATRALLHDQLAQYLEQASPDASDTLVDLLAYHYGRSDNVPKQRAYLLKAGNAAQAAYANAAAIDYFQRLLPLLDPSEQGPVLLRLGQVFELVGSWDAAGSRYAAALELAERLHDPELQTRAQLATGELCRKRGRYGEAIEWLILALAGFEALDDASGEAQVKNSLGTLANQQGDPEHARMLYQQALAIRRTIDDRPGIAALLSNLGIVARSQGDYAAARALHEEGLAIRRTLGNRWAIAVSLNNLGNVALDQGDFDTARIRLEEAVALQREVGDRGAIAIMLNNLANVVRTQGDLLVARRIYSESLRVNQELGDRWALCYLFEDIGVLCALEGDARRALYLVGAAGSVRDQIGAPRSPAEQAKLASLLANARAQLTPTEQTTAETAGRSMPIDHAVALALMV